MCFRPCPPRSLTVLPRYFKEDLNGKGTYLCTVLGTAILLTQLIPAGQFLLTRDQEGKIDVQELFLLSSTGQIHNCTGHLSVQHQGPRWYLIMKKNFLFKTRIYIIYPSIQQCFGSGFVFYGSGSWIFFPNPDPDPGNKKPIFLW